MKTTILFITLAVAMSGILYSGAGQAQQDKEKSLYLDASQELADHYTSALNTLLSDKSGKSVSISNAMASSRALFTNGATGFDLGFAALSAAGESLEKFLTAYYEEYAGYHEAKISLVTNEVINILPDGSDEMWQAVINRKLLFRLSGNDDVGDQTATLYFWFEKKNNTTLIRSISTDKCSNLPFIPVPDKIEATSDCATDQISVSWDYPYDLCGEQPVFKLFKSLDGNQFDLLSEVTAHEFLFYPNRGEIITLKVKVAVEGKESPYSAPIEVKAKNSPTNVKAREIILLSHIELSWDALKGTEYNIYRREAGRRSGPKVKIAKTSKSPFLDADYKQGKTFEYLVVPLCGEGVEATAASAEVTTAPFVKIYTSSPDIRKPYILVKWDKLNIDRSYRYCLYRAEQRRNRFRKVADDKMLSDTTYFDNTVSLGNDIYYKVTLTADTTTAERDISNVKSVKFSYKGIYFGFEFRPLRSRVENEFLDINPYSEKGKNSYASFAFTADYFFHDRIGVSSGLGISTFSGENIADSGYAYNLTYLDLPIMIKSPVIRPFNYKNKLVINPILAAGINFSFLVSKKEDTQLEFRDLNPVNISFVGAFGVNYYISRTLMMSFNRFYSIGLMDIATVYDAKTDTEYPGSNTMAKGFIIGATYKFK
ncbi:MAG: outer membrane beta-barrel protein [Bacteroidales bacterium]|nr:outer membrane beta-barrel protein [Bacteroidales bacterium]